ncbi:MAG: M23 family metallopeptidase [Methylophilaceae bacterium]
MKKIIFLLFVILAGGFLPAETNIPVQNASSNDWNRDSYWFFPWGESGVHKGIDIFAKKGTPTIASTSGIVIFKGNIKRGGNVIAILGPKWRIHYYAHLQSHNVHTLEWVKRGEKIGQVGDTGNAKGKPPHLHYSILSLIPSISEITLEPEGWKRMFYVHPIFAFTS